MDTQSSPQWPGGWWALVESGRMSRNSKGRSWEEDFAAGLERKRKSLKKKKAQCLGGRSRKQDFYLEFL